MHQEGGVRSVAIKIVLGAFIKDFKFGLLQKRATTSTNMLCLALATNNVTTKHHLLLLSEANHLHGGLVLIARVNFPRAVHQVDELRRLAESRERAGKDSRSNWVTSPS